MKKIIDNVDEAIKIEKKHFKTKRVSISRSDFFRLNKFFMDETVSYKKLKRKVNNFMNEFSPQDKTAEFIARAKYSEMNLKKIATSTIFTIKNFLKQTRNRLHFSLEKLQKMMRNYSILLFDLEHLTRQVTKLFLKH